MIEVCEDREYNGLKSTWFYNKGEFLRYDALGGLWGRIKGENLPNPMETWRARAKMFGSPLADTCKHPKTGMEIRLKPTEATFRLFEYWEQVCQAQRQTSP